MNKELNSVYTCWDCGGSGIKPAYTQIANGICFTCAGKGKLNYQKSQEESTEPQASDYCEAHGLLGCNECTNKEESKMNQEQALFVSIMRAYKQLAQRSELQVAPNEQVMLNDVITVMYTDFSDVFNFDKQYASIQKASVACDWKELYKALYSLQRKGLIVFTKEVYKVQKASVNFTDKGVAYIKSLRNRAC